MPYIDGEKGSYIHKLMYQSNEAFNKKNYELAISLLEKAWEKIEGNKIIYNESFLIVSRILDASIVLKDNARMKKWIDKIFIADPEREDSGERNLWAGKVAYELGELSKASEHFNIATKKSHGLCFAFGREDEKYVRLYEFEKLKEHKAVKLLQFIKENYCEEEEESFVDGLVYLREHTNLEEVGSIFLIYLTDMLSIVKKNSHRAVLIETIVQIEEFDFDNNKELLDEYVFLLSQKTTTNRRAVQCLGAFITSGVDLGEVFSKLFDNLNKKRIVEILVNINIRKDELLITLKESEQVFEELEVAKKISYRSYVIAQFLLLAHPLCFKYGTISYFWFNYYSVDSAIYDWRWYQPSGARYLVDGKIVTEKEAEILQRLGNLLRSDIELDSEEVRGLYSEFFNDKNPFEVMFNLPE